MLNNLQSGFASGKIDINNDTSFGVQGGESVYSNNAPPSGNGRKPVSSGQNPHPRVAGNFKNMLNRASDTGSLSGEGGPVKNKPGDRNNKHNNFGFVLYANSPLNTDKKQNRVILSLNNNGKDSGKDIKGNEASNGDINTLQGNKKSTQNPDNDNKDNFSGGNNTLSKSGTTGINNSGINLTIIPDAADLKLSPDLTSNNKNDNKKIGSNADTAGTQTNQNRESNLSLLKPASDNSINPNVNITDSINNILSKKGGDSIQNNKGKNNLNAISRDTKDAANTNSDKKNINSAGSTGIENRVNSGSINNNNIKRDISNIFNFTVQNYETKLDLARSNLKNDNNLTINKSIDFLNNPGLSNSNSGNLNGKQQGFNAGSGQVNVNGLNNAENGEPSGKIAINSVMFMVKKNIQSATITLKPPSLGNVKIDIVLKNLQSNLITADGGKAITINMLAQNDAAKNMLQSSSSNLQNALKGQGFSQVNLNVNLDSGRNNQNGNNNEEINKNKLFKNYPGGSVNGGKAVPGGSFSGFNLAHYNPDAIIDYFI
ncbi:MAG: flagellar hook-length control protein FliK [Deltaproteobacteria bacterium]|jgi:flagellar hook-length control protein FliK|nr:flagellar hook-length control protein FliK [Deltaproteobacteria bacterium]MCL5879662.1 flagellar hook-length control protein FliK [Deltaproteobacteria bacterium]MDA8304079.1 flagellar hook-length control protein FliK [Deltaproteobacteria bacterium]